MKAQKFSDLPVAILCGGKGTRLGELTRTTPKSLVEVNGRPFIYHQYRLLMDSGFRTFCFCIGHLAYDIIEYVDPSYYVSRETSPLGTGGAILNALPLLGDEFFVLYGDSYLPIDYAPIFESHRESGKLVTQTQWSGVDFGMNIFSKDAFDGFSGAFSIHEVFDALRAKDQLNVYQSPARYYEIGSPEGLAEVRELLK